jgi:RimJ/RimL family protein N-acetyltransferase
VGPSSPPGETSIRLSGIVVRNARRDDIPAIAAAARTSIAEGEDVGFGSTGTGASFADPDALAAAWTEPNVVDGQEVVVAELDGAAVGYTTLEDRGEALELVNIDVRGDLQGRGIGTHIVRFVEDRARREGRKAVTLGTSRNAAGVAWKSLPWWLHLGYRVTGEEENAWTRSIHPGAREIRMRKDVAAARGPPDDLELREVREADLDAFFEHQRDPVAVRMAAFTAKDPTDHGVFLAHWTRILGDSQVTARTVFVDGRAVGHVASFVHEGRREVTYWIGREHWGRGIATRALSAFLGMVETRRPVYAGTAADNAGSLRVLEKCGFRIVSRGVGFANARGEAIDEFLLELR